MLKLNKTHFGEIKKHLFNNPKGYVVFEYFPGAYFGVLLCKDQPLESFELSPSMRSF
jgi:hypothetical protein